MFLFVNFFLSVFGPNQNLMGVISGRAESHTALCRSRIIFGLAAFRDKISQESTGSDSACKVLCCRAVRPEQKPPQYDTGLQSQRIFIIFFVFASVGLVIRLVSSRTSLLEKCQALNQSLLLYAHDPTHPFL